MKKIIDAIKKALGMDKKASDSSSSSSGFTLIELLVVIAVIGVLAAGILIAINPLEQIRRAQDSNVKTQTAAVGRAVEAYYVNSAASTPAYPAAVENWLTTNLASEFKNTPKGNAGSCTGAVYDSGFCYATTGVAIANPSFVVYTTLNNSSDRARARAAGVTAGCTSSSDTFYVYSSLLGKSGVTCAAPAANFSGTLY